MQVYVQKSMRTNFPPQRRPPHGAELSHLVARPRNPNSPHWVSGKAAGRQALHDAFAEPANARSPFFFFLFFSPGAAMARRSVPFTLTVLRLLVFSSRGAQEAAAIMAVEPLLGFQGTQRVGINWYSPRSWASVRKALEFLQCCYSQKLCRHGAESAYGTICRHRQCTHQDLHSAPPIILGATIPDHNPERVSAPGRL